jgi:hypothetical protein
MATWIAHLRLAEILLDHIEGLHESAFTMGNIAPDSGMPDEKWQSFDPPKPISHFFTPEPASWQIADMSFYRSYLKPILSTGSTDERTSFLLGYFFHLITDNLWDRLIGKPAQKRWAEQFSKDPEFIWEIKKDWYGLDFIYLRDNPDNIFKRLFLDSAYTQEWLDFLPGNAIRYSMDYIKTFYQRTDEKVQNAYTKTYVYLTGEEMDHFVENTSIYLKNIWTVISSGIDETIGCTSILEIHPPNFITD